MDFEEDTYSSIFLALKHPVRRRILRMLKESPATYTQILNKLSVETGFLNYHLDNLSGLVSKGEDDKYFLSQFGEAALALITRVEAPVKTEYGGLRVFGFKVNPVHVLMAILAVLVVSNAYWINASQELSIDRTNALGEVLIQTKGFLDESIHIMNITVMDSRIGFELWDVLLRDLIHVSRQYKLVMSLDGEHRRQWSQIKTATDSLVDFVQDLIQANARNNTYEIIVEEASAGAIRFIPTGNNTYTCRILIEGDLAYRRATSEQLTHLGKIRDRLLNMRLKAFPAKITIGSNPEVNIIDSEITEAMETSVQLEADLNSARKVFNLAS